uniref:Uncharacterized protein n=1 Tax=Magallana gigas TaxID=29159 RepID=A0A8W8IHM6_MAGGI
MKNRTAFLVLIVFLSCSKTFGQSQPTPRGDCPGGYFQVSRTACFRHSQCPDRSFCWFTPTRTHGICCPYFWLY